MLNKILFKSFLIKIFNKIINKKVFFLFSFLKINLKKNRAKIIKFNKKQIVIYKDYRYKIKLPLTSTGLKPLIFLRKKKLLDSNESKFLEKAIGARTIGKPIEEIISFANLVCKKHSHLFHEESLEDVNEAPIIKISTNENKKIIKNFVIQNINQINFLNKKNKKILPLGSKVLEIGYSTGGHSLIAFQKIGFEVVGIDNFYYGNFKPKILNHVLVNKQINNNVNFINADITNDNLNLEKEFDLIYSTSVLEHIIDLEKALKQMHKLLKTKGLIFHNYNPFFSVYGGHALGNGDAPYMHLRLNIKEYTDYIRTYRPYEAEIAIKWLNNSMNRNINQRKLKNLLEKCGFKIVFFQSNNYHKLNLDINKKIFNECIKNYNFLELEDLLGHSVTFIASKE